MRSRIPLSVALGASLLSAGCASLTHYNTTKLTARADGLPQAVLMDAKQRAILSTNLDAKVEYEWNETQHRYNKAVLRPGKARVCAEPSPDALSALAASNSIGLSKGDLGLSQAMSIAEGAGSIGLRTQSIQLMRDAMYRLCEGHMSGALTDGSFETLHRRLQSSMVAILAIEQLTGAVKAKQIVLGGSASTGGSADAIQKLTQQTAEAKDAVDAAGKGLASAKTEQAAANEKLASAKKALADAADDAAKKAAQAKVDEAQTEADAKAKAVATAQEKLTNAEEAHKTIDEGRRAALNGATTASSDGAFESVSGGNLDSAAATAVAEAIQQIVTSTLDQQYSNEFCTTLMVGRAYDDEVVKLTGPGKDGAAPRPELDAVKTCSDLLKRTVERIGAETEILRSTAAAYNAQLGRMNAADLPKLYVTETTTDPKTGVQKISAPSKPTPTTVAEVMTKPVKKPLSPLLPR